MVTVTANRGTAIEELAEAIKNAWGDINSPISLALLVSVRQHVIELKPKTHFGDYLGLDQYDSIVLFTRSDEPRLLLDYSQGLVENIIVTFRGFSPNDKVFDITNVRFKSQWDSLAARICKRYLMDCESSHLRFTLPDSLEPLRPSADPIQTNLNFGETLKYTKQAGFYLYIYIVVLFVCSS